ncbi:NADP-dependent oxidoreductase [Streptomyces sp. NEAU-sy36]|uniref:NADP-dependent oxidoreductase n=1 Tax=unclassified Streptomyces TaxID=2593676 RepID=UPI0015D59981|nr:MULTISPECIES: NADP-dependent oxidoreductase [unclassified Streptomyces]QLJ00577.1 NADP-dependent oxidoreductase [Streptomyces sp. NEAU-sy36]
MKPSMLSVHQRRRPAGMPVERDFAFVSSPLPEPGPGTALVENLYLSVDPYMRENMDGVWRLGTPLEGRALGRVIDSGDPLLPAGTLVQHRQGWRTHALVRAEDVRVLPEHDNVPLTAWLGLLGGTGLSAYVGLTKVARMRPGETVFITAAAGGVGSAAGQIARLRGARKVIGSTGSPAKARHLVDRLGFDEALVHRAGPLREQLAQAAPDGIDVCLDNVGGEHLEAAIASMRDHGRIAWCGAIAQYNEADPPPAPRNLFDIVEKSIRLEGFLVRNHRDARAELEDFLVPRIQEGRVFSAESVTHGFEGIVTAFIGMLNGDNVGKTLVRVRAD